MRRTPMVMTLITIKIIIIITNDILHFYSVVWFCTKVTSRTITNAITMILKIAISCIIL